MASDKSIADKNIDDNTAKNLVPTFLVSNRPVPTVYCPIVGNADFLVGTHVIYTTTVENKVCVGCLLSQVTDGNHDDVMVKVNAYNIVSESTRYYIRYL